LGQSDSEFKGGAKAHRRSFGKTAFKEKMIQGRPKGDRPMPYRAHIKLESQGRQLERLVIKTKKSQKEQKKKTKRKKKKKKQSPRGTKTSKP